MQTNNIHARGKHTIYVSKIEAYAQKLNNISKNLRILLKIYYKSSFINIPVRLTKKPLRLCPYNLKKIFKNQAFHFLNGKSGFFDDFYGFSVHTVSNKGACNWTD